jgi:hypothetical protein
MTHPDLVKYRAAQANPVTSVPYAPMSGLLMVALMCFPIPVIFFVLKGNYSPRSKLLWSIAAVLETLASVALVLGPLYALRNAGLLL